MKAEAAMENNDRYFRVMTMEFRQEESYRIYLGFWNRLQQTLMRTLSFISGNYRVAIYQNHPATMAPYRK